MSQVFKTKTGDTSPSIKYALLPTSVVLTGAAVTFTMTARGSSTPTVDGASANIVTATGTPTVSYDWQAGDTDNAGEYVAEFEVTYSDGSIETFPNDGYISIEIDPAL